MFCGVSIKDKHREDNLHQDHVNDPESMKLTKVLGILNT